jgi:nucleotide-binding universal stress UspA family protein
LPAERVAILVASHDTAGARAAERAALARCGRGGALHHLIVVPEFWRGMRGDDWLNNAAAQIRFGRYVEDQLERELASHVERLSANAVTRGIAYSHEIRVGAPAACLIEAACERAWRLVVIGARRPKGTPGYRSRMDVAALARALRAPLLIVPHPER